ncbi:MULTISPECIES: hypothetical protein [unclassified Halorubrum]|uniref:hypothetical protein n=1 Tax=unclassified Halorubrum TaxID=2642239 RepID=UPI0010F4D550|nr:MULTISPECIES: hypothetical protein [unclassified Halorubrum]TKX46030.1 hypothetical protein EXE50_02165 [Halorubrum sp. ARQ200]TKX50149.1 hypothetical protein EXE49_08275 [Halorubrum sp. ASP121]
MADDDDDAETAADSGRLDRTTMETIGRRAETHPLVDSWRFEPDRIAPRSLVLSLDAAAYPPAVDTARLDVHWFVTGDYYFHYVERRGAARAQCRWDRHPKTDAPRRHFHPPPDAGSAEPSPLGDHHLDVLFSVLDWVTERVEQLHDESERA